MGLTQANAIDDQINLDFNHVFGSRRVMMNFLAICSMSVVAFLSFIAFSQAESADCRSGTSQNQIECIHKKNLETLHPPKPTDEKNPVTQFSLGYSYIAGKRVPQNVPKGIEFLQESAKNGNDSAFAILSLVYQTGDLSQVIQGDNTKILTQSYFLSYVFAKIAINLSDNADLNKRIKFSMDYILERHLVPDRVLQAQKIADAWRVGDPLPQ